MVKRIHALEVLVDDTLDENEVWEAIDTALAKAGFEDVLYGETGCPTCGKNVED